MLINNVGVSYPYAMFFHELGEYARAIKALIRLFSSPLLQNFHTKTSPLYLLIHSVNTHTHTRTHYLSS